MSYKWQKMKEIQKNEKNNVSKRYYKNYMMIFFGCDYIHKNNDNK